MREEKKRGGRKEGKWKARRRRAHLLEGAVIGELPYSLRNLTRMVDFSVQNNSITFIPLYVGTYRMIKNFTFESNPLQSPSQIILDKGAAFVLKYLLHHGTSYASGSLDLSFSGISLFPLELVQLV